MSQLGLEKAEIVEDASIWKCFRFLTFQQISLKNKLWGTSLPSIIEDYLPVLFPIFNQEYWPLFSSFSPYFKALCNTFECWEKVNQECTLFSSWWSNLERVVKGEGGREGKGEGERERERECMRTHISKLH